MKNTPMHTRELPLKVSPWALFRVLPRDERPFLIDAGRPWGSEWISSMGFRPRMQFTVRADDPRGVLATVDDVVASLAVTVRDRATARPLPFAGGAVVALAYEAGRETERLPRLAAEPPDGVRAVVGVYDAVLAYDHHRGRWLAASWHLEDAALARFAEQVLDAAADAGRRVAPAAATDAPVLVASLDRDAYADRVARIRAYIAAGDVYQVNLTLQLAARLAGTPLATYARLREVQPVPFGAYLDVADARILCNSPELFLRRRGDRVETCPIKGTRPRGANDADDARLAAELRSDAKERAEHVMIVDLERNDLGRICRPGTIRVDRFADVVPFATVQHLVSSVSGTLHAGVATGDLLRATFPSGSITGTPKIRAMEIIDEMEREPRGFYTGAIGWIDATGDLDLNVAIRTAVAETGRITYGVGGGIVAESDADRERTECEVKAEAFRRAIAASATTDASDVTDVRIVTAQRRAS